MSYISHIPLASIVSLRYTYTYEDGIRRQLVKVPPGNRYRFIVDLIFLTHAWTMYGTEGGHSQAHTSPSETARSNVGKEEVREEAREGDKDVATGR